mgnify:CR=1 FL=1
MSLLLELVVVAQMLKALTMEIIALFGVWVKIESHRVTLNDSLIKIFTVRFYDKQITMHEYQGVVE